MNLAAFFGFAEPSADDHAGHQRRTEKLLGHIIHNQEIIMLNTKTILAEVDREKADSALLRALLAQTLATLNDVRTQLADAIAARDPAALAAAQEQLDQAASTLSIDNSAAEAALAAAAPAAPAPAGEQTPDPVDPKDPKADTL